MHCTLCYAVVSYMFRALVLATACCLGWESVAPRVSAQAAPPEATHFALLWRAPEGCPGEQLVRETIEAWLALSAAPNDMRGIRVDARVERSARGFALDLRFRKHAEALREQFVAARCETLAGVVALKVALAADPTAWVDAFEERARPSSQFSSRLTAGLRTGLLPRTGITLEVAGTLAWSHFALDVGVGYALPGEQRYAELTAIGAHIDLAYIAARLCVLPGIGVVDFPLCGGAELGVMRGIGFGISTVSTSTQMYSAAVISPAVRWLVAEQWAFWLGFDGLVLLVRPRFHVRNLERLYRPEKTGARVHLSIEWRFP